MSFILVDGGGNFWALGTTDQGALTTTLVSTGPGQTLNMNDPSGLTSWLVSVDLLGVLHTAAITNAQYTTAIALASSSGNTNWSLRITNEGIFQTSLITVVTRAAKVPLILTPFEIPLQPTPQTLAIQLGGSQYILAVYWNLVSLCWMLDIYDVNENPLLRGIPLVTGTDLLNPFEYAGIDGELVVQTDSDPNSVPTFQNLGSQGHLYFLSPAAA